jgi:hypothetical protein
MPSREALVLVVTVLVLLVALVLVALVLQDLDNTKYKSAIVHTIYLLYYIQNSDGLCDAVYVYVYLCMQMCSCVCMCAYV